jgi:hypothetical protein
MFITAHIILLVIYEIMHKGIYDTSGYYPLTALLFLAPHLLGMFTATRGGILIDSLHRLDAAHPEDACLNLPFAGLVELFLAVSV